MNKKEACRFTQSASQPNLEPTNVSLDKTLNFSSNKKVAIAMSGGVDSSVAALLIKNVGYDCIGITMKLFLANELGISDEHKCCSLDDVEDARAVARELNIQHYVSDFSERFREEVIDKFICSYENGITPNPCIDCNRHLKFKKLFEQAEELGCTNVATGHYAQIDFDESSGRYLLKKAVDNTKDQSYVLYSLSQKQLSMAMLPLGGMNKSEVRKIAEINNFINAEKGDSQDICFVPDGSYADFIERTTKKNYPCGNFIDSSGNILGEHKGIIRYTVGQRKGLGLALPEPMYVSSIDVKNNTVILAKNEELFSKKLLANDINLISVTEINTPLRVKAKVRYKHTEQWATVIQTDNNTISVEFDEPQRAITKGQAVVLYDGDIVVGGGTII